MYRELVAMETVLKALADTTRLRILALLSTGETTVGHIQESLKIPSRKPRVTWRTCGKRDSLPCVVTAYGCTTELPLPTTP